MINIKNNNLHTILVSLVILTLFLLVLVSTASAVEAPAEEWSETYGRTKPIHEWIPFIKIHAHIIDSKKSIQQTTDGGYIIVGDSYGIGDIWLVKVKENGNEQWNKVLTESTEDNAKTVIQTIDGGYIIGGYTSAKHTYGKLNTKPDHDLWLIKTNEDGNKQWSKIFNESSNGDRADSIQQTTDRGYIIAGTINSSHINYDPTDICLIKIDENGNKQWGKTFGGPYEDYAISVQQTPDGGYLIKGREGDVRGFWFIKTDENGDEQWDKTVDIESLDHLIQIQQTTDGGYIFAGHKIVDEDYLLVGVVKTDKNGIEQWITLSEVNGGKIWSRVKSIQQTTDGGYIIAGSISAKKGQDIYLLKIDKDGTEQWNKTWVESDDFIPLIGKVHQTSDGGYIISGMADIAGNGYDYWLVKLEGTEKANSNLLPLNPVMTVFMFAIAFLVFKNRKA